MAKLAFPLKLAAACAAYFAVGWLSLRAFALINASASPVWPPTGIAIGLLILGGRRFAPAVLVGAFLVNFVTSGHWQSSILIAFGNTAEALLVAFVVQKWIGVDLFNNAPKTLAFAAAVVPATAISATVGLAALRWFDLAPATLAGSIWQTWWLGDISGALIFTPLLVLWARPAPIPRLATLSAVTAAVGFLVFWIFSAPGLLLLIPLVAWAGNQRKPAIMALVTTILAALAIAGTLANRGAFAGGDVNQNLIELQLFLAFFSATSLILAVSAAERSFENSQKIRVGTVAVVLLALMPLVLATSFAHGIVGPAYQSIEAQEHEKRLAQVTDAWQDTLGGHEAWLLSARAMFETNPDVSREMFHNYVDDSGWRSKYGGLEAVGMAPFVAAGEEAEMVEYWKNDQSLGSLGYPAPKNEISGEGFYVDFLVPITGNEAAFGFNVLSEPTRQAAIEKAISTGKLTASAPIILIAEENEVPGFVLVMPIYHGEDPGTPELRKGAIQGILIGALQGVDIAAFSAANLPGVEVTGIGVLDVESGAPLLAFASDAGGTTTLSSTFEVAGRSYELSLTEPAASTGFLQWASTFVLASGGVITIALTMTLYSHDSTRRRAHIVARAMTQKLTETQKVARLGSWEWDILADKITWSDQLFELFGQDPETFDTSFEGYLSCIHPEDRESVQGIVYSAFETGKSFTTDHRVVWPDGTIRWIHSLGNVEQGADGPIRMVGTAQDATERVTLEEQKRRAAEQVAEIQNLQRVDEFKTQFVNNASHELRTPLSPIMLQLHILKTKAITEDEETKKSLEILDRNMHRISELIDDFVSSSQYQAGRLAINAVEDDLRELVHEVYESFVAPAQERGVALELDCEGPCVTSFDRSRISQILYNLLSNAIKFTPRGGLISIMGVQTESEIKLSVTDSGQGISEDNVKKLFQPFSQVHDPMSITERGSGLGLYICKGIAEGHGGTIEVASAGEGKGSTFTLRLPLGDLAKI